MRLSPRLLHSLIQLSLEEDHIDQDITTNSLFSTSIPAVASIIAKEDLVLAGVSVAKRVFTEVDPQLKFTYKQKDGDVVSAGTTCCTISGDTRSLLRAERVALNFLQHLSGIATLTHKFCKATEGSKTKILDTRKTTPGLRALQKWAVTLGGGTNHRQSLKDGILIKDNHLALLQSQGISIKEACHSAKKYASRYIKVCIETDTLAHVREAIKGKPDVILLDNMSPQQAKKAIHLVNGRTLIELSGGITLKNIRSYAHIGADFISIGALTHSATAMDLSMDLAHLPRPISRSQK
ncbi:MAG: carboxylating nicotinate-nucleotide diphosphorylase [Nitrospirales bacterium]